VHVGYLCFGNIEKKRKEKKLQREESKHSSTYLIPMMYTTRERERERERESLGFFLSAQSQEEKLCLTFMPIKSSRYNLVFKGLFAEDPIRDKHLYSKLKPKKPTAKGTHSKQTPTGTTSKKYFKDYERIPCKFATWQYRIINPPQIYVCIT